MKTSDTSEKGLEAIIKNTLTRQTVLDAVQQYQRDRDPKLNSAPQSSP